MADATDELTGAGDLAPAMGESNGLKRPVRAAMRVQLQGTKNRNRVVSVIAVVLFFVLWELVVRVRNIPSLILPSPTQIAASFSGLFAIPGFLQSHVWLTVREIVFGYAVGASLGISLGVLVTRSEIAEAALKPFVLTSQMIPKLALAPVLVVWFGFGTTPRIVIVALVTFFPLLINTILGIRSADENQRNLFRISHASRWFTLTRLEFPGALPAIISGLRVSIVFAVTSAVVSEFIGGTHGLGALIIAFMGSYNVAHMFATLVVVTAIGMTLYGMIALVERRLIYWHESVRSRR